MKSTCVALLLLLPTVAAAQGPTAQAKPTPASQASITLSMPGLNCSTPAGQATFRVLAWSWGASNPPGGTVPSISDLNLTKSFDGCSPALLGLVTTGDFLKLATLTQQGADGTTTATLSMEGVVATSWQASSSTGQDAPTESVSLSFRRICLTDTASGSTFCYAPAAP
jgi:hypothetical protein